MNNNSGNSVTKNITVKENLIIGGDIRSSSQNGEITISSKCKFEGPLKKLGHIAPLDGQALMWNDSAQEWLPGTVATPDTRIVKVFTGTTLNTADIATYELYTQPNHSRSVVKLKVFAHDVNSDTFYKYLSGEYMWYREWTNAATRIDLGEIVNVGSGEASDFTVDLFAEDNVIKVRFTHNTIETNVYFKIIAKILFTH